MFPTPLERVPPSAQTVFSLRRGELAFRQGDPADGLCFVEHGQIELQRYTETGECLVIHRARPRETFAEASLFSDTYHCDAVASEPCRIRKFGKQVVLSLFAENPEFAVDLAARFASQIQALRRRLELLAIRSAEDRVLTAFSDGMMTGSIVSFAREIGLTHESTYRALAVLVKKRRIVKASHGHYHVA